MLRSSVMGFIESTRTEQILDGEAERNKGDSTGGHSTPEFHFTRQADGKTYNSIKRSKGPNARGRRISKPFKI